MIFETHAHYDDKAFDEDREKLIGQLQPAGIGCVVNIGASLHSCQKTVELMEKYDFIYGAIGVHPSDTAELNEENFAWLAEQCRHKKCVAVGEIGLDYYHNKDNKDEQKDLFIKQLNLAKKLNSIK